MPDRLRPVRIPTVRWHAARPNTRRRARAPPSHAFLARHRVLRVCGKGGCVSVLASQAPKQTCERGFFLTGGCQGWGSTEKVPSAESAETRTKRGECEMC